MNHIGTTRGFVACAAVLGLAGVAAAQQVPVSSPQEKAATSQRRQEEDVQRAIAEGRDPPDVRGDAVATMPTFEAFGSSNTETIEETFFRLSRDFASTSELASRRLGHVPIWPRGDLKIGPVRILPFIREGVEWESNFWKQSSTTGNSPTGAEGRQTAWTHSNEAGLLADTALMGGRLRLALSADAIWDVRYARDQPDSFEFDGQFAASYRFVNGAWVRAGYAYEKRDDPIDAGFTKEFDRTNHRTFFNAGFDRDIFFGTKLRYEAGVTVRDVIGRTDGLNDLDRTETQYYLKASYPFWRETTRIFGRARYRQDQRESQRINDGRVWGFDVGIEGSIPLREGEYRGLRGQVSVGFDTAVYEDDTFDVGSDTIIADDDRRNTNLNIQAALQYLMSPRTTLDLRLLRTNQFSYYGNFQVVDRADFTVTHTITPCLVGRFATYLEHTNPSGRFPNDTTDMDVLTESSPHTTRWGVGVGLRYRLNDWADLDWSYDYERRNSEIRPYTNHRSMVGITFYLNALKARPRPGTPQ